MSRNKVLEKAKVTMPSGRSAFDLSQIRSYDALAGELNVCYCQPMVAGTKGRISRKCFTRTSQVVSPAFHSVTEHFDFFIVPIHSLWRYWENWKLNINDLQDTLSVPWNGLNGPDLDLPVQVPRMDFNGACPRIYDMSAVSSQDYAANTARLCNDILRLSDSLGYDEFNAYSYQVGNTKTMNLFMIAAYQKCYFDHYRNTAYESNNPYAYNLDWLSGPSLGLLDPDANQANPSNLMDIAVAKELFKIRRVNYRNDYFHNIYPALNYVSSQPQGLNWSIPSGVGGVGTSNSSVYGIVNASNDAFSPRWVRTAAAESQNQILSVQTIRAMFALDKLMRASAYAPKHVREQYKALYGVEGVEDFDMKSERIGSFQSNVVFQEVINMAESTQAALGQLGAKGVGGEDDSKPIKFYCKYDSIVIGLHYFMPRARYDSFGLHPWNTKLTRESFYIKAFENLGLRPFYAYYVDGQRTNVVLGWTVPNFEYKILPDLNTGSFKRKFVDFQVHEPNPGSYVVVSNSQAQSELSTFVPHNEQVLVNPVSAEYFKVAPEDLNNIFAVGVNALHSRLVVQFFGEFRISVPVVAPMSVHGQPSL